MAGSATPNPRIRLLVIDDDVELGGLVTEYLEPEGFEVHVIHDSAHGIQRALANGNALVVLDATLRTSSGFEVLRRIRVESKVPVLMLTARDDDAGRIVGLEIGADDCLPAPFNPCEFVARIRAILRRTNPPADSPGRAFRSQRIVVGDVEIDAGARVVRRRGERVALTGVEHALLETLLRTAGAVVPRDELSKVVLGRALTPYDRSLDMHVSNLRKKLGHQNGDVERIKAVRGVGYLYTIPCDSV